MPGVHDPRGAGADRRHPRVRHRGRVPGRDRPRSTSSASTRRASAARSSRATSSCSRRRSSARCAASGSSRPSPTWMARRSPSAEMMVRARDQQDVRQHGMIDPTAHRRRRRPSWPPTSTSAPTASSARREDRRRHLDRPARRHQGPTTIGRDNRIFQFASIGDAPQDKKYEGEPTRLEIGDRNMFREYSTINRGTATDGG